MRLPLFGCYLLLAACFSATAIALHQPFAPGRDTGQSLIQASAPTDDAWEEEPAAAATVTQVTPNVDLDPAGESAELPAAAASQAPDEELAGARDDVDPTANSAENEAAPARAAIRSLPSGLTPQTTLEPDSRKEGDLLDLLNAARLEDGQATLERRPELDAVALARAKQLVKDNYFDHYGPDGSSAFSELSARGISYTLAGENLARNNYPSSKTVEAAFDGLMASPGHRANILESTFGEIGVAAVRSDRMWYYVMVFTDSR